MRVLGLKTCDKCRRALRDLRAAGHDAALRDLRADPLPDAEIRALLDRFGPALVNRTSTTWRGLDAGARNADPAALLAEFPALMKRPVIITPAGEFHLGWEAGTRAAVLSERGQ